MSIVLQQLIQKGRLEFNECMVDQNNRIIGSTIELELLYNSPDGSTTNYDTTNFQYPTTDESMDPANPDEFAGMDASLLDTSSERYYISGI